MEHLAHALWQAYGLRLERSERIDFGIWEDSFSVWTDQGRLYAKRFRRKDRKDEDLRRGLRLSQELRAQGFPAPAVLRAHNGDRLAYIDDERYYVTEWVEGRTYHPGECPLAAVGHMGAALGHLHRLLGPEPVPPASPFPSPQDAAIRCGDALAAFAPRTEPFADIAREVLTAQVAELAALPADFAAQVPLPTLGGRRFGAFWVEQVIFHPNGQVAAFVDWTDGAGSVGLWAGDIDLGMHLGAMGLPEISAFVAGYQAEHPLPESEWRAIAAGLCYGYLASPNFLPAWLNQPYRRMADWEQTSARWHRCLVHRWRHRDDVAAAVVAAAQQGGRRHG